MNETAALRELSDKGIVQSQLDCQGYGWPCLLCSNRAVISMLVFFSVYGQLHRVHRSSHCRLFGIDLDKCVVHCTRGEKSETTDVSAVPGNRVFEPHVSILCAFTDSRRFHRSRALCNKWSLRLTVVLVRGAQNRLPD